MRPAEEKKALVFTHKKKQKNLYLLRVVTRQVPAPKVNGSFFSKKKRLLVN
jgi:hypothetical protein